MQRLYRLYLSAGNIFDNRRASIMTSSSLFKRKPELTGKEKKAKEKKDKLVKKAQERNRKLFDEVKRESKQRRKLLPSKAESNSFAANMFRGQVVGDEVFPYPEFLNQDQKDNLREHSDKLYDFFIDVNDSNQSDVDESIAEDTIEALKDLGMFGLQTPVEFGGLGFTNLQFSKLKEIMGMYDLAIAVFLSGHQSIGFKAIELFGTPEQQEKYLPNLTAGAEIAAFALAEPESGSDAGSIRTKAEVDENDPNFYIVNGNKICITNGGMADIFTVLCKIKGIDPKTGNEDMMMMTALIVERKFGGVTSGPPEKKMGIKGVNTAEIHFDQVRVPKENVLGEIGQGYKIAMAVYSSGRSSMGACLSGTMRVAIQKSVDFATKRKQFGVSINYLGGVQEKIARMSMLQYIAESMSYMISANMDKGYNNQIEAAICKIFCTEAAWYVVDETIQIHGGLGYMKDGGLEKILRDLRVFRIFEGSNDVLRVYLALSGHLGELLDAIQSPIWNFGYIMSEGIKRYFKILGIIATDQLFMPYIDEALMLEGQKASRAIFQLGRTVEELMARYGNGIVIRQFHLNRIANSAIDCYAMAVVLSRATHSINQNLPSAEHEVAMVRVWCQEASERVFRNLKETRSARSHFLFKDMAYISQNVCQEGGVVQNGPLGFSDHIKF